MHVEDAPKDRPTLMTALILASILFGYVGIGTARNHAKGDIQSGLADLSARYAEETNDRGERKYTEMEAS